MEEPLSIEGLIQFITRFVPTFSSEICGATPQEIDLLASLIPEGMPRVMRDYQRWLGRNDAGFQPFQEPTTEIEYLIRFYQEYYQTETVVPANCIVIAAGGASIAEVCIYEASDQSKPVFMLVDGKLTDRYGDSLEAVAFQIAAMKYQHSLMKSRHALWWQSTDADFDQVVARLDRHGLIACRYSDSCNYHAELPGLAVACIVSHQSLIVRISSDKPLFAELLVSEFVTMFGCQHKQLH